MDEPVIRPARPEDLHRVLAIEAAWPTTPGWSRESFESELRSERSRFLVAERSRAVAGFAVLWVVGEEAELLDVAVAPETAGRGLGRRLLEEACAAAREAGCKVLRLEVSERNERALKLYRRAGLRVVGRRPKYYNDGSDALLMDKPL